MSVADSPDGIDVRLGDGVTVATPDLGEIRLDGGVADASRNILSHAHGDHLFDTHGEAPIVCSDLTARLVAARRDAEFESTPSGDGITLLPAGHVAGSRAALIESDAGTVLYTGDVSTRSRYYLDGFEPVPADVLVIETTYGRPAYRFPPVEAVEAAAVEWLAAHDDRPALLFGYTLGKAQKILKVLERADLDRVFTTDAILRMNEVIAEELGVSFAARRLDTDVDLGGGDAVVLPSGVGRFEWVERLRADSAAVTAGFSGWAADESYVYRRNVDAGFQLSDHGDFGELLAVVESVDPEIVYTTHGFTREFATELTRRGYAARALEANQATLGDFSS